MSEENRSHDQRLQYLEQQAGHIHAIKKSVDRIELELIGDPYGSVPTFKSRLERLEKVHPELADQLDELNKKSEQLEERQTKVAQISAGGAGVVTLIINAIKSLFNF